MRDNATIRSVPRPRYKKRPRPGQPRSYVNDHVCRCCFALWHSSSVWRYDTRASILVSTTGRHVVRDRTVHRNGWRSACWRTSRASRGAPMRHVSRHLPVRGNGARGRDVSSCTAHSEKLHYSPQKVGQAQRGWDSCRDPLHKSRVSGLAMRGGLRGRRVLQGSQMGRLPELGPSRSDDSAPLSFRTRARTRGRRVVRLGIDNRGHPPSACGHNTALRVSNECRKDRGGGRHPRDRHNLHEGALPCQALHGDGQASGLEHRVHRTPDFAEQRPGSLSASWSRSRLHGVRGRDQRLQPRRIPASVEASSSMLGRSAAGIRRPRAITP